MDHEVASRIIDRRLTRTDHNCCFVFKCLTYSNAWSKSRIWNGPAGRCEQILDRMIKLSKERPDIGPDTTSFNTVIDTLAKSKERDREQRAEALLEKMQELSSNDRSLKCQPDHVVRNETNCAW